MAPIALSWLPGSPTSPDILVPPRAGQWVYTAKIPADRLSHTQEKVPRKCSPFPNTTWNWDENTDLFFFFPATLIALLLRQNKLTVAESHFLF